MRDAFRCSRYGVVWGCVSGCFWRWQYRNAQVGLIKLWSSDKTVQCTLVISGIHKSLAARRVNAYAHVYARPYACVRLLQTHPPKRNASGKFPLRLRRLDSHSSPSKRMPYMCNDQCKRCDSPLLFTRTSDLWFYSRLFVREIRDWKRETLLVGSILWYHRAIT